jgi:tetratricopeptide (TPR) repeat protein
MMHIGRMTLGRTYALQARDAGLKAAPANFYLYAEANTMAEPKWGGGPGELEALRHQELAHAAQNPLLHLIATEATLDEFDFYSCDCDTPPELARVMHTLQDPANYATMRSAAYSADIAQQHGLAAVYYAEAIRFAGRPLDRLDRAFDLVKLGYPTWAHDELTAIAPALPGRGDVYRGLGYADLELEENTRATGELEQAVRIDNTDTWSWERLGTLYTRARQWDKAWDVADQLIRLEPDAPDGWRLRAQVQMEQPRDGLADTEQAFAKRFGQRPDQQAMLGHMREALAHLKH